VARWTGSGRLILAQLADSAVESRQDRFVFPDHVLARSGRDPKIVLAVRRHRGRLSSMLRRLLVIGLLTLGCGCVERTVSITTEPQGAKVFLNDQEVGDTPVKVPFTWYGDYDIIARKEGYETLRTNYRLNPPWYQLPIIDLFAECLVPFTIHDNQVLPVLVLEPRKQPDKQALLRSADELRRAAAEPDS